MITGLHLMLVHFPIALLVIYVFLEYFKRFTKADYWFNVRSVFLYLGIFFAVLAIFSGSLLEGDFENKFKALFELHETFATITLYLYSSIALYYILVQFKDKLKFLEKYNFFKTFEKFYINLFSKTYVMHTVLLFALISIIVTGSLGAAMAQGPNIDPVVSFVYGLFFN